LGPLAVARGEVRDGVASVEHFLQVLASRRIGPRVVARGIPEVVAGCGPLRAALSGLAVSLRAELAEDPEGASAADRLLHHAARRVADLEAALGRHCDATAIEARERLGIEAIVRGAASELATIVHLVDLLGAPLSPETTTIDLDDALGQRQARAGATPVLVQLEVHVPEVTVVDARLFLELLERAVAIAVQAGVAEPRVTVELDADGYPRVVVDAPGGRTKLGSGGSGHVLDVSVRDPLPDERAVICAAARRASIDFQVAEGGRRVTLSL
jgi:hypothetical protein